MLVFALAAMSDPRAHEALDRELAREPYAHVSGSGVATVHDWFALDGGAVTANATNEGLISYESTGPWSRRAAILGLALAQRADAADLSADWDRWTDPATGADELVARFGVAPLPSPRELLEDAGHDGSELPVCG